MSTTPSAAASAAGTFKPRQLAQILGRNQGPELFQQVQFATLQNPIIQKPLTINRPLERIHLVWQGRITIGVAAYSAGAIEQPQTLIQRIRVNGIHNVFGSLVPLDISGATAFSWMRLFREGRGNSIYVNKGDGNGLRLAAPFSANPQGLYPEDGSGTVLLANPAGTGAYDLEMHYSIPVGPVLPTAARASVIPFLWQAANWADTLQLQLFFGDATSLGTPAGGTTIAFSAFGSNTGSPLVSILLNYDILGPLSKSIAPAVVVRSEQVVTSLTSIANAQKVVTLQKQKTMNVLMKSGTLLAGTSAGVVVYATLNDYQNNATQPIVDNKPVRNNQVDVAEKEYTSVAFATHAPRGYLLFTFVDSMNPLTYYRGDLIAGGSTFELDTNVVAAAAGNAVSVIQEQVIGDPVGAS